MRYGLALLAILVSRTAFADDPRDLFGLGKKPKADEPPPSCDDPHTFGCAMPTDPLDDPSPLALSTWLPADYLRKLPLGYVTHDAIAHYGLGASRDDVGVSFGGATGLENRWTIEGAPTDSLRTGGNDTRVPLPFLSGLTITAGGFSARDRVSTGGTIDAELIRGGTEHVVATSVWAGLSANSARRPIAPLTYQTRRLAIDAGPEVSAAVVAHGPLGDVLGGRAWYAAGVAPSVFATDATWEASRLTDLDGDGQPDLVNRGDGTQAVLQQISVTDDRSYDVLAPAMVRVGLDKGPHQVDLTLIGHGSRARRWLANATQLAAGTDRTELVVDGIATWRGRWKDTRALVQLAWHRSDRGEAPSDDDANAPQRLTAFIPSTLPDDPLLAQLCNDNTFPNIPQCPVPTGYFASAGAGLLVDSVADRPTMTGELAHRTGRHTLRVGATFEDARLVQRSRFTGGEQTRELGIGNYVDVARFFEGECGDMPGTPCNYIAESELRYRTRYTAAYLQDTWSPGERFRVDGGLRWELMWVGPRLHFSNQLAPRLGFAWDPLGEGRSRVWASMGRAYAMLPAGLGATVIRRDAVVHDATSDFAPNRDVDVGAAFSIASDTDPITQDEVTTGVELGLASTFRLVAWAQGRYLKRGLETTSAGFGNPGAVEGDAPARRDSETLAVEIATTPTARLVLRAGYLYGRTVGNSMGPYDPRQGVILHSGSDWNGDTTSGNLYGALPTSAGHRLFVEADRGGKLGSVEVRVATRLTLVSGRPRNAFASTLEGVLPLVPRGDLGRGPMLAQANVRLAARWRGVDVTLDVFNVFDRQKPVSVFEVYTDSEVRPIEGGEASDLVFLKTTDGANPSRSRASSYGLPVSYQAPIAATLGLSKSF